MRLHRKADSCRAQGFTLLELVVVLALLTLLMSLVLPGLLRSVQKERSRVTLRDFSTVLRLARSQATTSHERVRVFLNKGSGRYWLEDSNRHGVLEGMRLGEVKLVWQEPARQGYIAFYPDGSSSGGKIVMTDPAGRLYAMEVDVLTGKVTVKIG
jgi:general secretion pathway protein H